MEAHDFLNLDKPLAPRLIKIVYWVGLALILLLTLWHIIRGFGFGLFGAGIIHLVFSLVGAVLLALVWRIICELWTAVFSINDRLGIIADQKH